MPRPIRIRVWGDFALFMRPELKEERYTYDIITPTAARGIFDSIYYHPGLKWEIKRIFVLNPICLTEMPRVEVPKTNLAFELPLQTDTLLREVSYIIEANFKIIPEKMGENDSADKFYAIFSNRLKAGKCLTQPYLGCREFTASFEAYPDDAEPETIDEDRDFGIMPYDMDYSEDGGNKPVFFRAVMKTGIVDLRDCRLLR